jgi:hypothetical protein
LVGLTSAVWCEILAPGTPSLERTIEQLGDRDYQTREKAARAIEALGVEALPALLKARNHQDPEIRKRIEQWLPGLERSTLLAPRLVSLHLKDKPVREAFAELAKQTGYKIEIFQDAAREKRLQDFDFDKLPFWEAMDQLCTASGAILQPSYGDDVLRLQYQDRYAPFVCRQGAFRIVSQSLDYGRSIQFGSLPKTPALHEPLGREFLRMTLSLSAEPRLPLLGMDDARLIEAYDDQKQSMLPPPVQGSQVPHRVSHYWGGYRTNTMTAQVNLGTASRGAKSIQLLKGVIPLTLVAEQKDVVVTGDILKAKGKKFKAANLSFDIQDVIETPNKQYQIKMIVANEDKSAANNDYNWYNSLYYRTQLRDEKGEKFTIFGSNLSMNNNSAQVTFTFGRNGGTLPPTKLVYQDWTTLQHEVPFEFKDLPLP